MKSMDLLLMNDGTKSFGRKFGMLLCAMAAAGILSTTAAGAFLVDDQVVSDPLVSLVDPEYNQRDLSLVWSDAAGNLWRAWLDPETGALFPMSGYGELIDTGLVANNDILNGAEWVFDSSRAYVVYNKRRAEDDRLELYTAYRDANLGWLAQPLTGGLDYYRGIGTGEDNTGFARLLALRDEADGKTYRYYSYLFFPATERRIDDPTLRGARFVDNRNGIIATAVVGDNQQVVYQWMYSDMPPVPLSSDAGNKSLPMMWWAPEFQEYVFFANIDTRALGLYRKLDGTWKLYYRVELPTTLEFVQFPRLLVYQGRSYVALVAAEKLVKGPGGQWIGLPWGECEIWLVGIDPNQPLLRRVSDDSEVSVRTDPEFVTLQSSPVIYYSQWNENTGTFVLRRADTGL